jgi:hypothetical protein
MRTEAQIINNLYEAAEIDNPVLGDDEYLYCLEHGIVERWIRGAEENLTMGDAIGGWLQENVVKPTEIFGVPSHLIAVARKIVGWDN